MTGALLAALRKRYGSRPADLARVIACAEAWERLREQAGVEDPS